MRSLHIKQMKRSGNTLLSNILNKLQFNKFENVLNFESRNLFITLINQVTKYGVIDFCSINLLHKIFSRGCDFPPYFIYPAK